jgi:hypothetical protein
MMDMQHLLYKYYYGDANHIIYHSIIVMGILVGAIRFSKLSISSRMFFLLLVFTIPKELFGFYCAVKYRNNSPISNIWVLVGYCVFCLAFYIDSKIKPVITLMIVCLLFSVVNSVFFQNFLRHQADNTTLVISLCQIIIYFLFLILYFKVVDTLSLRQFPLFWIGMGVMLFSIVSIVSFGFTTLSRPGGVWYIVARYARNYSNYLLYLLFIPAFLSPQNRLRDFTRNQ